MIVECPDCESKVDCEEKGAIPIDDENHPFDLKAVLVQCRVCHRPIFGYAELILTGEDSYEWGEITRQWPPQETEIDGEIPEIARISLIEAKICFKAKAFSACAVMCGRTIEGVCKHHDPKIKDFSQGLKTLKDDGIIEHRLFEWGEALRIHRNLGAHATTEKVSKADARDLLDFTIAICEYVFVLNEKFQRFQARRKQT